MYIVRETVEITTAADGSATFYTKVVNGRILSIQYVKDGITPFDDGVDFAITLEITGQGLWTQSDVNASAIRAPRQPTHDGVGAASLYAATGEPVEDKIVAADERVKIVIAAGGNSKKGKFHVTIG